MQRDKVLKYIIDLDLNIEDYIVVGSGLLAALQLRPTRDIDIVVRPYHFERFKRLGWHESRHDNGSPFLVKDVYDVSMNWGSEKHWSLESLKQDEIIIEDVPFVSLTHLARWKQVRRTPKDIRDLKLIQSHGQKLITSRQNITKTAALYT